MAVVAGERGQDWVAVDLVTHAPEVTLGSLDPGSLDVDVPYTIEAAADVSVELTATAVGPGGSLPLDVSGGRIRGSVSSLGSSVTVYVRVLDDLLNERTLSFDLSQAIMPRAFIITQPYRVGRIKVLAFNGTLRIAVSSGNSRDLLDGGVGSGP